MWLSWLVVFVASLATAGAMPTITAYGNKFFTSEGKQFIMRGIAYQLTEDDPLADPEQCRLDAQLMQTLGANAIRVYHVDPAADHKECMAAFAKAGIYTLIDLDTFSTYILPNSPAWTQEQYKSYAAVMDAFSNFDNSLGFFVGNEIISINNQSMAAPFIKAAARDMKAYRDSKGYRKFPIGYSAADIAELRPMLQDYLTCGGNASQNVDFFALNSYSWCDPSNYVQSGYKSLQAQAKDFPVPIFFSETGCNVPGPRLFEDQKAIFGPDMVRDWSGSLVYEWIQEQNHYGLISYGPPTDHSIVASNVKGGFTRKGTPTPVVPDFANLKSQWDRIPTATGVSRADYTPSPSTRACPASTKGGWLVDGNVALPALGESFRGTYTPAPTAPPNSDSAPGPATTSTQGAAASPLREFTGMTAALAATLLFFVLWG
ncbi:glycolipid-anchored surface protein 5 [Magnaporthiopsis poae ATCC 64411]|uniref:1,3-beta-glucanosyltransferase n=1 Tax=Magnaporthiopsis poae (strain ATCC 64411 / 73-15) TaxID=644358 RepID=A0A0C4DLI6_MAGP6|nr:glycolipid-anchored surface protein 5 [Magnaporthiopsis poae ATCC 64411]